VITMENHGPLHLEKPQTEDRQRLYIQQQPDGCDDLTVYLHHLEQADRMLGMVRDQLAGMQREGLLCLYGDHLPIMPQVYRILGEPDGTVDYLIWSNKQQRHTVDAQPRAVEQLAAELLRVMVVAG
ncbi:MAG: sulfatase-like hydrolase/transferase, partial [Trichlorobacter sp.]|uniref:sulfatase-like hydrolase/transferase n=1 Tax=Trichlorobacter sp. TaxID=2911007 RepID=UPI0025677324